MNGEAGSTPLKSQKRGGVSPLGAVQNSGVTPRLPKKIIDPPYKIDSSRKPTLTEPSQRFS